jgi:hypothetical protein
MKSLSLILLLLFALDSAAQAQTMFVHTTSGTTPFVIGEIDSITFSTGNDGRVAWWPLDEGSGSRIFDHSGNAHHSDTLTAGITWNSGGISLGGGNNFVRFEDSAFQSAQGSWQVMISADSGESGWIVSKDDYGFNDDGYLALNTDGTVSFVMHQSPSGPGVDASSTAAIPYGQPVTITAEWGNDGMKLFINDDLVGSNPYTGPILSVGRPFTIGTRLSPDSFTGDILDVQVFNVNIR